MSDIVFTINQTEYKIDPLTVPIDTSLNTFIRTHARLTGTKFMCLEGGCGACIVNLSGLNAPTGESKTFAVNSCLWPVYSCDGLNVTTIEGLGGFKDGYHAIQKALYHFSGSQCGYCSPGMIMNMYSLLEANNGKVSMEQVENSFGGNICRCTGYRPILDAFKSLATDSCSNDIEDLTLDSCQINKSGTLCGKVNDCKKRCPSKLNSTVEYEDEDGRIWIKAANLADLLKIFTTKTLKSEYMLVAGNTAHGVYRRPKDIGVFIDIKNIPELHTITANEKNLKFGGNVSLTDMMSTLQMISIKYDHYSYANQMANHIDLVANVPVRSAGTIAGNLSIKHAHNEFPSDIFLILETVGAQLDIISADGLMRSYSIKDYLTLDMKQKIIVSVVLPKLPSDKFVYRSYKIMPRAQNAHAMLNAGFLFEFDASRVVKSCRICYGGIHPHFIHAEATELLLTGVAKLYTNDTLQNAIKSLQHELEPNSVLPDPSPEYRKSVAIAMLYRFFLNTAPQDILDSKLRTGSDGLTRSLSSGVQTFVSNEKMYPLTEPVLKYEGLIQCAGEAQYSNDFFSMHSYKEELWAAFVPTTDVHSKLVSIDASKALKIAGVHSFIGAKDIPGDNTFMPTNVGILGVGEKEEIFLSLDSEVLFHGQPCGLILAKTMSIAEAAVEHVEIGYEKMENRKEIIPCLSHWLEKNGNGTCNDSNTYILEPNVDSVNTVPVEGQKTIKGDFEIGAQYHFTMEPQTAFAFPNDDGGVDVYCPTQYMDLSHIAIAKCLNIMQSKVNIIVKRVGGGFGGKISHSSWVACACALATFLTRQPVRFVMTIESNMRTIGKRYANATNYEVSVDSATAAINNLTLTMTEDYGYSFNDDVSLFTMGALQNTPYARPNQWKIQIDRLKTDAPSSTWFRAPGTMEAVSVMENLMEHIARETNKDPALVRVNNIIDNIEMKKIVPQFIKDTDYYKRKEEINEFNKRNRWRKKGIAISTMRYPVEFICEFPAYVAVYHGDGTVAISHGGAEIGQGIHTKVAQVAAYTLGIPLNYISIQPSTTLIAANQSLTGASITSESICMATKKACEKILERMKPIRDSMPKATWLEVVQASHDKLIDLTEKQTFKATEAKPYDVVGSACSEIEMDVLTGNMQILRVDIVEDVGQSMSPLVDVGQIEGAFMMGVGYWLTERLDYDRQSGELLTNRSWNYKVPGAKDIPIDFRIKFLQNVNSEGILRSKTTGEPAICLAIVVQFALRHAIDSVRVDNGKTDKWYRFGSGNTPDIIFESAETKVEDFKLN